MSDAPVDLGPLIAGGGAGNPGSSTILAAGSDPLLLLPVRLETRFVDTAAGGSELLVRIYPDQIHVDAHDPRLSPGEEAAGKAFWLADWRAGNDAERRRRAWQALAGRLDPARACWVAQATAPTNADARPDRAVPDSEPPAVEPVFPAVALSDRTATPVARLLPAAWNATVYSGGQIAALVTGQPITADPAVGPDLDAPLVPGSGTDSDSEIAAIDEGMNWLVDFAEAERIGMALRLNVSGPVDLLLVAGVRDADIAAGAAGLEALLDAQRFTAGLGFIAAGTPTNNSRDTPSGWSSAELGKLGARGESATDGTAAAITAHALGIDDAHFVGVGGSERDADEALAAAVARTLWPATWGYWLTQFVGIGAGGLRAEDCDWARDHAVQFVRPGGPLPALRIGRQPYGVLPVTAVSRFRGDDRENRLAAIVLGLIGAGWRPSLGKAARVGREDPTGDLVDILRSAAVSSAVSLRRAFGPMFAANALAFLRGKVPAQDWLAMARRTRSLTDTAGLPAEIFAALTLHEPTAWPVELPLIGENHAATLTELLTADIDALAAAADTRPPSVLAALVRQSLLREHAVAAQRLIANLAVASPRDRELFGFDAGPLGWTAQRDREVGGATVRTRLTGAADPARAEIDAFLAAARLLGSASADRLGRAVAGALDAASHRIDAWATSLATRRLTALRRDAPTGLRTGGYGWIEGLHREPAVPVVDPVADEPGPLLRPIDDPGFIHAPSIHQAQVAAMLRNVHLANGGGDDDPFAISITSQRVRLAQRIFDGVRAGRSLGTVLGYLVERDLHESGLDAAIDNARAVGQEAIPAAARRVDGLKLHELWTGSEDHAVDHLVPGTSDGVAAHRALRDKAKGVLRRLNVAVDAAADLLQAEQVHHFARGNLTAAVNTLGDIERGLTPPPELDFVRTPRSGVSVTHRVAILLAPGADPAAGWAQATASPRSQAEPALDAWLSRRLGPATTNLTLIDGDGAEQAVPLADLKITASDFVRLAGAGEAGVAELAARAARAAAAPEQFVRPRLSVAGTLADLLELARSLGLLLGVAKPLDGTRLQPPHFDPLPGIDLGELATRAAQAEQAVRSTIAALDSALADTDAAAVDAALAASWDLSLGDAALPAMRDEPSLRGAAERARAALAARLPAPGAPPPPDDSPEVLISRIEALLGPGTVVLPRFVAANAAELAASRDDPALAGEEPLVAETWLTRLERVREPLMRLGIALREAEAMGGAALALDLAQVPHQVGAAWNGRPAPAYVDGAASLVLVGGEALTSRGPLAGLLIDEFTEFVPAPSETTGIAFRYEPPQAMAPQSFLLAVPPVIGESWTIGTLNQVLLETLELARLRALDPEDLDLVRQFLPATVFPFNTDGEVPSTNPNALSGP